MAGADRARRPGADAPVAAVQVRAGAEERGRTHGGARRRGRLRRAALLDGGASPCGRLRWCGPRIRTSDKARQGRRQRRDHPPPRGTPLRRPAPRSWWTSAARCASPVSIGCRPVPGSPTRSGRPAGCVPARTPGDSTARGSSWTVSKWWSEPLRLRLGPARPPARVPWAPAAHGGRGRAGHAQHGDFGTAGHVARRRPRTRPAHHRLPHPARWLPLGRRASRGEQNGDRRFADLQNLVRP